MSIYIKGIGLPKDGEQYHRITICGNGQAIIDHGTYYEEAEAIPTDDVRPVVRGKWENAIHGCGDSPHIKCSVCGTYFWQYFRQFNWCPICGADMRQAAAGIDR